MVKKLNAIDTRDLVKKNAKIKDIVDKITSITNLATTAALTSVENKIPNVTDLAEKVNYDAKISQMEKNILLLLIIMNFQIIYLVQR